MKRFIIFSAITTLMFFLFLAIGFAKTDYYNYTQRTSLGHRAFNGTSWDNTSWQWTPPNPFNYTTEANSTNYEAISYFNDSSDWAVYGANVYGEWDVIYFHFNISQNPELINRINVTWRFFSNSYLNNDYNTTLQIWNSTGREWVVLNFSSEDFSGYYKIWTPVISSGFSDFVNISGSDKWIYFYGGRQYYYTGGGSCPFIYSWNGSDYVFEHEAYPFAVIKVAETTTYDRLHSLKEDKGELKIKIEQVLRERDWTDSFKLFAIEHPGNDSFVMPDYNGNYHTIKNLTEPISCTEHLSGKDCLKEVKYFDDLAWRDSVKQANVRNESTLRNWIVLEFPKPENASKAKLFFSTMKQKTITNEWEYYIDQIGENFWDFWQWFTSYIPLLNKIFQKLYLNMYEREIKQHIQIWDGEKWIEQGSISAGDSLWDDFLIILDISKVKGNKLKIRFYQTTGHYTVNYVAIDYSEDEPMKVKEIKPYYAVKNGKENVLDLLLENDEKYAFLLPNDTIELRYKAPEKGEWKTDYAISTKGYYNFINFKNQSFFGFLSGIVKWLKAILIPYNVPKTVYPSGYIHNTVWTDYFGISVEYTLPPQYSLNSTNSTLAGTAVSHNLFWQDDVNLSGYIFSFWNGSDSYITPKSVVSFCGESPPFYANETIDGNIYTSWEELESHEHWIVYDLGVEANISKIRLYTHPPSEYTYPCSINTIYVSNDLNNLGDSLGSCILTGSGTDWRECSFTSKVGRYIKITFNTTDFYGKCGNYWLSGFLEFQAYTSGLVNDTWKPFNSSMCLSPYTECWSNVTKVVNSTAGATIKWCVHANDTSNIWNSSCLEPFSYTTTSPSGYLEVNLKSPPADYTISQNYTLWVNASIICRNGNCGNVYGTVRYNASSPYPDTPISTTQGANPFYITDSWNDSSNVGITNQISCGNLNQDQVCNLSWLINTTGAVNSYWKIGVLFNSSLTGVQQNHTANTTIHIVECIEDMDLSWTSIDFSQLIPDTPASSNPAPGNSNKLYNITNKGTCALNIWIKGTDLQNTSLNSIIKVGNLTWSNYSSEYNPNWASPMSYSYSLLFQALASGLNLTTYYWLAVPPVYSGIYKGNIIICGNYSSICIEGE
ncbi:MAG: discoidin domain-containing protein [Candidatus Aenigmatarchaeota archaeon]